MLKCDNAKKVMHEAQPLAVLISHGDVTCCSLSAVKGACSAAELFLSVNKGF